MLVVRKLENFLPVDNLKLKSLVFIKMSYNFAE